MDVARGVGTKHGDRVGVIADAVLAVVADEGLGGVSYATVAARAGISTGQVQHYFPSRRKLVAGAFERANAANSARITARLGGRDWRDVTPREALTAVLLELVPTTADERAQTRVRHAFNALALSDPAVATQITPLYAHLHDDLAGLVERDRAAGLVRANVDSRAAAVRLSAAAEGAAFYVLLDVLEPDAAAELLTAAVDDLYV